MHLRRDMPTDVRSDMPGDVARDVPADMRDGHETFGTPIACLHASVYGLFSHVRRIVLCFFIFYFMYGHETTHR